MRSYWSAGCSTQLDCDRESGAEGCCKPLAAGSQGGLPLSPLLSVHPVSSAVSSSGSNPPLVTWVVSPWPWSQGSVAGWCLCCSSQQPFQHRVAQQLALALCWTLHGVPVALETVLSHCVLLSFQSSCSKLRTLCLARQSDVFTGWQWKYVCRI